MKERVPGMRIHEGYMSRMTLARNPEEEGVAMAVETIQAVRNIPGVRGIHVMPALWESITPRLVKEAGLPVAQ
jgi:methylenetetrahydrofolate reductase (NADPH)